MDFWRIAVYLLFPTVASKLLQINLKEQQSQGILDLPSLTDHHFFKNCFLHTIEYEGQLRINYHVKIPIGIQLVKTPRTWPHNKTFLSGSEVGQFRNSKCILHVLIWPHDIVKGASLMNADKNMFSKGQKYLAGSSLPFQEFWLAYTLVPGVNKSKHVMESFINSRIPSLMSAAVFWVPLFVPRIQFPWTAYVFCWYCGIRNKFQPVHCTSDHTCFPSLLSSFKEIVAEGSNIEWNTEYTILNSPSWPVATRTVSEELETAFVASFLFETVNRTFWNERGGARKRRLPTVTFGVVNGDVLSNGQLTELLFTGYGTQLRFITSNQIEDVNNWFIAFLSPFAPQMWIFSGLSLGAVILTSLIITADWSQSNVAFTVLSFASSLLQLPVVISGKSLCQAQIQSWNLLLTSWVLALLVITNGYKGILKSNYIVEPEYTTGLKRLHQLENFSLYVSPKLLPPGMYVHIERAARSCASGLDFISSFGADCESKALYGLCTRQYSKSGFCEIIMRHHLRKILFSKVQCRRRYCSPNFREWIKEYDTSADNVLSHLRHASAKPATELVKMDLRKPKSAYLTSREHLANDWNAVKGVAKVWNIRFAHNGKTDDGFLSTAHAYQISRLCSAFESINVVLSRAKTLMESGIYDFYKEWERFRTDLESAEIARTAANYMALSLENSDVGLIFLLYFYCLCGACAPVFLGELLLAWLRALLRCM